MDTELQYENKPDNVSANVCFELPGESGSFDCALLRAFTKLEELGTAEYGSDVTIMDGYQTDGPSIDSRKINGDDSASKAENTATISFEEEPSRTYKTCAAGSEEGTITCTSLNFSTFRNFSTPDGSEDL